MPEPDGVEHSFHDLPTGVRIHLAAAGPVDAPPMLALHGWPQHWWSWRDVIAALAGEFRLLCPDLRGLGWSGQPADDDFRKQRLAEDAIALLDTLGLERVRLVGHDWGAWVVRDGRHVRWMLHAGRRDATGWAPGELEAYLDVLREPGPAHASSKLYRDFLIRELPASAGGAFRGRRPQMPARLLLGSREPFKVFSANFPGELDIVKGAGHFLPEEAPQAVAERIRAM